MPCTSPQNAWLYPFPLCITLVDHHVVLCAGFMENHRYLSRRHPLFLSRTCSFLQSTKSNLLSSECQSAVREMSWFSPFKQLQQVVSVSSDNRLGFSVMMYEPFTGLLWRTTCNPGPAHGASVLMDLEIPLPVGDLSTTRSPLNLLGLPAALRGLSIFPAIWILVLLRNRRLPGETAPPGTELETKDTEKQNELKDVHQNSKISNDDELKTKL